MPAGSFFQANRIVLEAFSILSGDDFSGIFMIILIFCLNQTGAQSHSQRFKEFIVVLKLIQSQCTYHIFSTKNSVLPNSFSTFSGLPVYGNFKSGFVFQPYDSKSITDSDS